MAKYFWSNRQDFPGNLEKFHCNPKEFQREGVVGVVLMREEKAFSEERKNFTSRTKLCCFKESLNFLLWWLPLSRCYRTKVIERC